jgi:hypothetical protein
LVRLPIDRKLFRVVTSIVELEALDSGAVGVVSKPHASTTVFGVVDEDMIVELDQVHVYVR